MSMRAPPGPRSSPPLIIGLLCAALLSASAGATAAKDNVSVHRAQAREAVAAFAAALKGELLAAMQAGGPLAAIETCKARAPAIAAAVSLENGMRLSRVSERNRNPMNAPNGWQAAVLRSFDTRTAAGEDADTLEWDEIADAGPGREYRYMKAIPTGALCLQCHGQALAPPVAARIAGLYPDDKATGFGEGDLRGAFVVVQKMEPQD